MDTQHARNLLDRLGPGQLAAVVQLLETMVAAEDSDALSNAERRVIAEADEWLKHNQPIPHEEVLAEFGLTIADSEKFGQEPVKEETPRRKWLSASSGPNRLRPTFTLSSSLSPYRFSRPRRATFTGEGNTKQLRDVDPPLIRLRAQDNGVFFRDKRITWRFPACWIARRPIADGLWSE